MSRSMPVKETEEYVAMDKEEGKEEGIACCS
jgi:hypothetical protein